MEACTWVMEPRGRAGLSRTPADIHPRSPGQGLRHHLARWLGGCAGHHGELRRLPPRLQWAGPCREYSAQPSLERRLVRPGTRPCSTWCVYLRTATSRVSSRMRWTNCSPPRRWTTAYAHLDGPHGVRTPGGYGGLIGRLAAPGHATRTLAGSRLAPLRKRRPIGRPTSQWPRIDAGPTMTLAPWAPARRLESLTATDGASPSRLVRDRD